MKKRLLEGLWLMGVLLVAGFCLSACSAELDVQQAYPFRVETMPVPKELKMGEQVEIRCTLSSDGDYEDTRYTLRFFQFEGKGCLQIGKKGKALSPNDRYPIEKGDFRLYYRSESKERQNIEVVIEDNHKQSQRLTFDFNHKQEVKRQ